MRYNKRSSSACDWPFHFTPLFYQNRPPPSCHPKLYSSECQCHTLCFAAPKVFLTSCNFDENKKSVLKTNWQALPRAGLISSYEFQKAQLFIWFNLAAAAAPISAGPMSKVSMKNGCQSSVGAYSCWYIIFSPVSIVQAGSPSVFCTEKKGSSFQKRNHLSILYIPRESPPYLMPLA